MPYIDDEAREKLHRRGYALDGAELNYIITYHIDRFLRERVVGRRLRYADLAEALAAAEGAKREFQRCVMDPYEAFKRGDRTTLPVLSPPDERLYRDLLR